VVDAWPPPEWASPTRYSDATTPLIVRTNSPQKSAPVAVRPSTANPALSGVASLIRSSHERWDGTGYPDRLRGDQSPIGAHRVRLRRARRDDNRAQLQTGHVKLRRARRASCRGRRAVRSRLVDAFLAENAAHSMTTV
jgi:HD domain